MARSVAEWFGRTDDTPVPPRVRLRVLEDYKFACDRHRGCGRDIRAGDHWICDHIVALINGGKNREKNLHPLCQACAAAKDKVDVNDKSRSYRIRARHYGIRLPRAHPLPGSRASGIKIMIGGGIRRRLTVAERHKQFLRSQEIR